VWDGRFEIEADEADEAGVTVLALKGRMARLSPAARCALKAAPPAARPTLPAIAAAGHGEGLICPILEQGGKVRARRLVGERLAAACGTIAQEIHANLRRRWRSDGEGPILGRQVQ
jgi:tRNA(Ile)-lysidine synthase